MRGHRLRVGLRRRLFGKAEHVAEQVFRRVGQPRMIHREGHRQLLAEPRLQSAAQFDGHQRIHAEIEESGLVADLCRIDPGHLRHRAAQVFQDEFLALLDGRDGELLDQLRCSRGRRFRRRFGDLTL